MEDTGEEEEKESFNLNKNVVKDNKISASKKGRNNKNTKSKLQATSEIIMQKQPTTSGFQENQDSEGTNLKQQLLALKSNSEVNTALTSFSNTQTQCSCQQNNISMRGRRNQGF